MLPQKHRRACSSRTRKQLRRAGPRSAQLLKLMLNIWHGTAEAAMAAHGASYLAVDDCSNLSSGLVLGSALVSAGS